VAYGAAVQGGILKGEGGSKTEDLLLLDVRRCRSASRRRRRDDGADSAQHDDSDQEVAGLLDVRRTTSRAC
jgi:hypothetical protein